MTYDVCQAPVALSDPAALAAWDGTVRGFLSHGAETPQHLARLLELAPDFALAWSAKGLFCLLLARREMVPPAREAALAARRCGQRDPRGDVWTAALQDWLDGRPSAAADRIDAWLARHPHDTASAKLSQAIRFMLGDAAGMRRSTTAVLPAHGPDHPLRGYLLGCHAFALEETGDYDAAEAAGLEGLAHAPNDAWGLHAVAHVYDMTARPDLGLDLIARKRGAWDHCNNFRYHVWWHQALLHLDRGEPDAGLALYDDEIRADRTDDYRDIANATSLLMRLELDGVDVGARWEELADLAEARTDDGCLVFADLHYLLALGAAGRDAAAGRMTCRFTRDARREGDGAERGAEPGLAALTGLISFAGGQYGTAFLNLARVRHAMQSIGGSHAQRDVFERMTVDAGLRAGYIDDVERILDDRQARRAGREDRFSATRRASLADRRRIPAE